MEIKIDNFIDKVEWQLNSKNIPISNIKIDNFYTLKDQLLAIINFIERNRGAGTTSLLNRISKIEDVHVLTNSSYEISQFNGCGISAKSLSESSASLKRKPILFESSLVYRLCDELIKALDKTLEK